MGPAGVVAAQAMDLWLGGGMNRVIAYRYIRASCPYYFGLLLTVTNLFSAPFGKWEAAGWDSPVGFCFEEACS